MNNISLFGEKVLLYSPSKRVLAFDILYSDSIIEKVNLFQDFNTPISNIEAKIFEWSDGTLIGEYLVQDTCNTLQIEVSQIKYISDNTLLDTRTVFSTDSGVICIIDRGKVLEFLTHFKYENFVDILNDNYEMLENYMNEIKLYTGNTFSIVSTPGVGKGFDFDGSGGYYIDNECFK